MIKKIIFLIAIALTMILAKTKAANLNNLFKQAINEQQVETFKINRFEMSIINIIKSNHGVKLNQTLSYEFPRI